MMFTESDVVIQEPDGTLRAVSPQEAKEYIKSMPPKRRKRYDSFRRAAGLIAGGQYKKVSGLFSSGYSDP